MKQLITFCSLANGDHEPRDHGQQREFAYVLRPISQWQARQETEQQWAVE